MKNLRTILAIIILSAFSAISAIAANQVDLSFKAVPSKEPAGKNQIPLPDGKVIVWGSDLTADAQAKGKIARLNSDGTLDTSFNYCSCNLLSFTNVVLGADGKLLVAGNVLSPYGYGMAKVIRLSSDGSVDATYTSGFPVTFNTSHTATILAIQPDGKMIAQVESFSGQPSWGLSIWRLNTNGTVDSGFNVINATNGFTRTYVTDLVFAPDGKFYVARWIDTMATVFYAGIARYNPDGTADATWEAPAFSGGGAGTFPPSSGPRIWAIALKPDGDLLVTGDFTTVNAVASLNFVELKPAGNVDLGATPFAVPGARDIKILPSGQMYVSNATGTTYHRLNADGSIDNTFMQDPAVSHAQGQVVLDSAQRLFVFGNAGQPTAQGLRLGINGGLDPAYNTKLGEFSTVAAIARQADGKLLVAGDFREMNGFTRSSFARINANGGFDPTFNAGSGFDTPPASLVVQPDGKILALGAFTSYNGVPRPNLVRINADGSLDAGFAPVFGGSGNPVKSIALQADGKIVAAGVFSSVNGAARTGVARLNSDGSTDAAFNPVVGSPDISAVAVQAGGKIMFGGYFNAVNGFARSNLARLNTDGTLDTSFNGSTASGGATFIFPRPDGKYVITYPTQITRRNADGSADNTFTTATFDGAQGGEKAIKSLIFQADGKILAGGRFVRVNTSARTNLARIRTDGTVDQAYTVLTPNDEILSMVEQPNGRVVIGGKFTLLGNVPSSGIARITPGPVFSDFDGDGKSDLGVYRPSNGNWYIQHTSNGESIQNFGIAEDLVAPGDYDGDGKADLAIFRPSTGTWWYRSSINNGYYAVQWGTAGVIPLASDFDADGKTDFVYYNPSNSMWHRFGTQAGVSNVQFGSAGDIPVAADMDGDGKADLTIFRPSTGYWWYRSTVTGLDTPAQWGAAGDMPVAGDYDGDGRSDYAVWRPSNGVWYIHHSSNGNYTIISWGVSGDKPVAADYDGDGKTDIAIYRPSTGVWFILQSSAGFTGTQYGISTDKAIPNAFVAPEP